MYYSDVDREMLKRLDLYLNTLDSKEIDEAHQQHLTVLKLKGEPSMPVNQLSKIVEYIEYIESKVNMLEYENTQQKDIIRTLTQYMDNLDKAASENAGILNDAKIKQGIY